MESKAAVAWDAMQTFEITVVSGSPSLFANGRQQVKVGVEMVATLEGVPAVLSEQEFKSITLIGLYSGEDLKEVKGNEVAAEWSFNRDYRPEYDFYPASRDVAAEPVPAPVYKRVPQYKELYVQTAASGQLKIAVRITRDDGETFQSSDEPFENNAVTLTSVPVPGKAISDYSWIRTKIEGNSEAEYNFESLDYYECGVSHNGRSIQFRTFDLDPVSIGMSDVGILGRGSYVGFSRVGEKGINYTHEGDGKPDNLVVESAPGTGTVVLFRGIALTNIVTPTRTTLVGIDSYGNPHTLTVTLSSDRRQLSLS